MKKTKPKPRMDLERLVSDMMAHVAERNRLFFESTQSPTLNAKADRLFKDGEIVTVEEGYFEECTEIPKGWKPARLNKID